MVPGPGAASQPTPTTIDLHDWIGRLVTDHAAQGRARGYWLRRQAEEEGTFAGVLADLSERGRSVIVHLHNGRRHRGRITGLGSDFVGIEAGGAGRVMMRLDAIASVRTTTDTSSALGDRIVKGDLSMTEALLLLAEDRCRVLLVGPNSADAVSGELRAVGRDVATVRLDGDGGTAYVALTWVAEVSLPESG